MSQITSLSYSERKGSWSHPSPETCGFWPWEWPGVVAPTLQDESPQALRHELDAPVSLGPRSAKMPEYVGKISQELKVAIHPIALPVSILITNSMVHLFLHMTRILYPSNILTLVSSSKLNSPCYFRVSIHLQPHLLHEFSRPVGTTKFRLSKTHLERPTGHQPKVCQSTIFAPPCFEASLWNSSCFLFVLFQVASRVSNCSSWVHYSQSPLLPCPTTYGTTPKTFALIYSVNLHINLCKPQSPNHPQFLSMSHVKSYKYTNNSMSLPIFPTPSPHFSHGSLPEPSPMDSTPKPKCFRPRDWTNWPPPEHARPRPGTRGPEALGLSHDGSSRGW